MADGTKIEWTDATWNPITGCAVVSPGCTNCYAMRLAGTRLRHLSSRAGLTRDSKAGPVWTGETRLNKAELRKPLRWRRPRKIFVCAHGDLFAESVPDDWIDRVFAVMALAPQHTFQVLTKRARRMRDYLATRAGDWQTVWPDANPPGSLQISRHEQREIMGGAPWATLQPPSFPLPNVRLGVSAEDQTRADERIPDLLATPAAVRWVSAEPLLGPIDFLGEEMNGPLTNGVPTAEQVANDPTGWRVIRYGVSRLDWIVAGGESGAGARPMHPAWARSIRDQCVEAGVPFFFKQVGEWASVLDRDRDDPDFRADYAGMLKDGGDLCWLNLAGGRGFHGQQFHVMRRVGKARAGRLLDGREHNDMPEGAR